MSANSRLLRLRNRRSRIRACSRIYSRTKQDRSTGLVPGEKGGCGRGLQSHRLRPGVDHELLQRELAGEWPVERSRRRGGAGNLRAILSALALGAFSQAPAEAQSDPAVEIVRLFGSRAVHLQTVGELYTGEQEAAAAGSGLLVADDLVLTNNHVVPGFEGQYRSVALNVRVGSRSAAARVGTVIMRDAAKDLALVQIGPAVTPTPFCPISALAGAPLSPQGTRIYVLSYPLDEDFSIVDGLIRNTSSDSRWLTSAILNPNDSGGPAFTAAGYLIGVVVGGIKDWTNLDGVRTPVFGMNYIIPTANLASSGFDAEISRHAGSECWQLLTSISGPGPVALAQLRALGGLGNAAGIFSNVVGTGTFAGSGGTTGLAGAGPVPSMPGRLSRSYGVEQLQAIHAVNLSPTKRRYGPFTYGATAGYRIVSCTFAPVSINHASELSCNVAPDGTSAIFSYALESGPAFDRWRGWLNGTVVIAQEKLP